MEGVVVSRFCSFLTNLALCIFLGSMMATKLVEATAMVGVNYGMLGDNLPPPSQVVSLMQSISINKTKIFTADPSVLQAFANTGISIIVGTRVDEMADLAQLSFAVTWLNENILPYYPYTHIIGITVGNEVLSSYPNYAQYLLPAMQNLQTALKTEGLDRQIWVSTAHSLAVLGTSFPPSMGAFQPDITSSLVAPLLQFLSQTGSPFLINVYPFLAYISDPKTISLSYALFDPEVPVVDPESGLEYTNMFDAQVDAVHAALDKLGYSNLHVLVSETGWPSRGDPDQPGASVTNAELYIAKLSRHLASGKGTPMRPKTSIDVYVFALFNENLKPGPTSERNYGLLHPDGSSVYDLRVVATSSLYSFSSSLTMGMKNNLIFMVTQLICLIISTCWAIIMI